jgi:4-carboxymuconolactone decarboxylase
VARFEDVKADQLTPDNKALYETVRAGRPKLVGPFSVLMHNPPLARAVNQVVDAIRRDGKLDKRLYELVVLITARHAGAAYAWAVHDPLGRKAGLSGDVVEAILAKRKPDFAKADEKAIYDAVTELLNTDRMGNAAYQELIKQFGLETTIEIVTCVGLYCMIGGVINAFEVPTANGEKPF